MFRLLSDNPQTVDRLGFQPMAEILVDVIRGTEPPFTIGVFGEWGSGKTTLMTLVQTRLRESGAKTVWFNAWKYDGKEVIWNALIQTIFYAMREDAERDQRRDFLERVGEAAANLAMFAAKRAVEFIPGGLVRPGDVDAVADALHPLSANDEQFDFINKFEATFDGLVKEYVGADGRLVVFVDDLDRCLPENAIQVLEAIKLYLDRANVTFVIGAERAVVEEGIRARYKGNVRLSAKEYLEKIVQLPFVMRSLSEGAALDLITPYAKTEDYAYDDRMLGLIFEGTESNPRRVKRFINTFYVLSQMSKLGGTPIGDDLHQLAVVLLIQMRFPQVYDDLVRDPGLIGEFHRTLELNVDQRDEVFRRRENLRQIYQDASSRRFFEALRGIDCSAERMARWVRLTKGNAAAER